MREANFMNCRAILLVIFLVSAVRTVPLSGQEASAEQTQWGRARGILRDPTTHDQQGVEFYVVMPDTGEHISTEHQFRSGDRFTFRFVLKREAYVYLLNRTLTAVDPVQLHAVRSKGVIRVVSAQGEKAFPSDDEPYYLLLPTNPTQPKMIRPGGFTDPDMFRMDDKPGLEILTLIVSPKPLDISRYLIAGRTTEDTPDAALQNLETGGLAVWRRNCEINFAPPDGYQLTNAKGIREVARESYALAGDSAEPFAFEITLVHLPSER
jgi:hypothetical protein